MPTLIGEVGLATRSMWWNRSGRPRSATRKYRLATMLASAPTRLTRRSAGRPVRSAPAASSADPPTARRGTGTPGSSSSTPAA